MRKRGLYRAINQPGNNKEDHMNITDQLADALQRLAWAIEFNDKDAARERMPAAREALATYNAQLPLSERVKAYNDALNDAEIAPNGDDYNNLLDIINGASILPHREYR